MPPSFSQQEQAVRELLQLVRDAAKHARRHIALLNLPANLYAMEDAADMLEAVRILAADVEARFAGIDLDESPVPPQYRRAPGR
jgi:hypothetical protein